MITILHLLTAILLAHTVTSNPDAESDLENELLGLVVDPQQAFAALSSYGENLTEIINANLTIEIEDYCDDTEDDLENPAWINELLSEAQNSFGSALIPAAPFSGSLFATTTTTTTTTTSITTSTVSTVSSAAPSVANLIATDFPSSSSSSISSTAPSASITPSPVSSAHPLPVVAAASISIPSVGTAVLPEVLVPLEVPVVSVPVVSVQVASVSVVVELPTSTPTKSNPTTSTPPVPPTPKSPWTLSQSYSGSSFLDGFDFFAYADPTHGNVNFVTGQDASSLGLAYTTAEKTTVLRVDNSNWLDYGVYRNSVRIGSKATFGIGSLVILDAISLPYGPTVWPAFWSLGDNWPNGGEIDIIEGVNGQTNNQITLHSAPGCYLATPMAGSGQVLATDCDTSVNYNEGCGVKDPSSSSYGAGFNAVGGGVYAMSWTKSGIAVYFFPRASIPSDITSGSPNPAGWGSPRAFWSDSACSMTHYFTAQTIVFDITICGDWSGSNYDGGPSACAAAVQNPSNYDNAVFEIKSLSVYSL